MTHPNILLITVDQMRFDHLGLKGVRGINTPNLDRLGREGIHCDRGYTCSPICTPARVSLLTGQYPSIHGGWSVGTTPDPFPTPHLPDTLRKAGYATALFGKHHFVKRLDEEKHISKQNKDPDDSFWHNFDGPYVGFEYCRLSSGHTTDCIPSMHYRTWLQQHNVDWTPWFPLAHGELSHTYNSAKSADGFAPKSVGIPNGAWSMPVEYHDSTWIGNLTCDWINEQKPNQPWFCMSNFQDPHSPFHCPEPYFSNVRREELSLFEGMRPNEFDNKPRIYKDLLAWDDNRKQWYDDFDVPNIMPSMPEDKNTADEEELTNLQATMGMIKLIDDQVGRILSAIEKSDQADNTIVVFTCDHGETHGHHGLWGKGLAAYDDCQRVPFLIWGPGIVQQQGTSQALVNVVDLPRTFLSLAGCDIPQGMQGCDLSPLLRGETQQVQDSTLIELRATGKIYQQTFITDQHKLIVYDCFEDDGELYDVQADPDQYDNLWHKQEYATLKSELLHKLARFHMQREGHRILRTSFA